LEEDLGIGENATNAVCDDGNTSWEDISFQDDIEIQRWAQHDDIMSCEILPTEAEAQEASVKQEQVTKKFPIRLKSIRYKYIRMYLLRILHHLEKKQKELAKMPWWLFVTGMYQVLPHQFFTTEEQVAWKIMLLTLQEDWIMLPGPARWWEGYSEEDFQKYWDVPVEADFQEIAELACTIFMNCEAPENAEEIMDRIQILALKYL